MRKILTTIALCCLGITFAQETGTIAGKLLDKEANNQPLPFANVVVQGTAKGASTDFDGLFEIPDVPVGTYTLEFRFTGYQTVEVPNVLVEANKIAVVDATLGASAAELEAVVIKVVTSREREEALLLEQKAAVTLKTSIGAQELAKKGVGDVGTAVTKVTGISKQEGSGNIFVRGLGDRYNITTLNGLPLPSNDPSKKNIQLGIFNTSIVEAIGIDKTYNPENFGDFGGANIDISSKDYKGKGFIEIGFSSGINTETTGADDFFLTDGPNRSGFYDIDIPAFPLSNYNFETSWDRQKTSAPVNSNISLKLGDSYNIFGGDTKLSVFGVGSFSNNYSYREGISRGGVTVNSVANSDFDFFNYAYNTNTTLMGNIGIKHGQNKISYNALFLNNSSEQQKEFFGIIDVEDDAPNGGGFIQRAVFQRTTLITHQLLGDHEIGKNFEINWGGSYNFLEGSEPNRRQVTLVPEVPNQPDGPRSFRLVSAASDNHRFYSELLEEEIAGNLKATYKFKKNEEDEYDGKVTVGYSARFKNVDFEATQFNFQVFNNIAQPTTEIYDVDAYFNQQNLNSGLYRIRTFRGTIDTPNALDPQFYEGDQTINSGFINFEYAFSPKFTLLAGVRGEQINQTIAWSTSLEPQGDESELDTFEILPALSLKYEIDEKQNIKFASSKTYTLPQYKERAPFLFQEVNQDYFGNENLDLSTNYNVDLKWESFPKSNEIISVGVFGKLIENPINAITIQSASNDITWANTGDQATAFGAELEVRKVLFEHEADQVDVSLKNSLTAGINAAYMITNQELDGQKVLDEAGLSFIPTYTDTGISGASDLVANADLSYYKDFSKDKNIQLTLAANYFSDRIFAIGNFGKGNIIEKGVPTVDFVAKTQLTENITIGLSAKNLFNPSIERFQEAVDGDTNDDPTLNLNFQQREITILSYKKGYDVKLSLAYKF
ncbi:TonB-dependent receptor [Aquimarina sp. AD10]|uniref:TonB-dependent receptor n=1 Tax=Aquimarina sp. AD10 TaxID=1714849 RepID=UPI000E469B10|nr:TonB-dependent receptor [Aquimarina sp. AD10]AXT62257.1 TonB-dependent receptor [Aquimarina sp. AD10]RKM90548.1 TonB-dependent receptor [Aquimarina sp. AD10]